MIKELIKRLLTKWVLKNYPLAVTTEVHYFTKIFVKKGKRREWRTYDQLHNRVPYAINHHYHHAE